MIRIISFSGLDGSGKSTQAQRIIARLTADGEKVYYFHATNFSLPQALKRALKPGRGHAATDRSQVSAGGLGIFLRKAVLPVDLVRFELLALRLKRRGYTVIVSDRYFYDTLVNIAFLSKASRLLHVPMRKPDPAFYIDTDIDTIMRRDRQPDQGIDYLRRKKKLYDLLARQKSLTVIDGTRTIDAVFDDICRRLT